MNKVLKQDMEWFDKVHFELFAAYIARLSIFKLSEESLASHLSADMQNIRNGIGDNLGGMCTLIGTAASVLAISFSSSWLLTLIMYFP